MSVCLGRLYFGVKRFLYNMYLWVCLVALLAGSHAQGGRGCSVYLGACMAKGKTDPQQRPGKGQSNQQCVENNRRTLTEEAKCLSDATDRAIAQKECSCVVQRLSWYKAQSALVEPISQRLCIDLSDVMAPSCDRSVLTCYLDIVTFIQSVQPKNAGPGDIGNALFGKCSADQSGKLDKVKSCIADLKNKDLSGCGFLNYYVTNLHAVAVDVLKYVCTGCNMVTVASDCLNNSRIAFPAPTALCNKEELNAMANCMQQQMNGKTDCANLNVGDTLKAVRATPIYAVKQQVCGTMEKVAAEYETWGCPDHGKGKGPYGKGKRDLEHEYSWQDLVEDFVN